MISKIEDIDRITHTLKTVPAATEQDHKIREVGLRVFFQTLGKQYKKEAYIPCHCTGRVSYSK